MSQPPIPTPTGQVAVGNYRVEVHAQHGAIVHLAPPDERLPLARGLRDREAEAEAEQVWDSTGGRRGRSALAVLPNQQKLLLATLAALGGGPVGGAHLAAVAGVPDPAPALDELLEQRVVEAHSSGYSLTGNLTDEISRSWSLADWRRRGLDHFLPWAEANGAHTSTLLEEAGALRHLLGWAVQSGLPDEALRLGRPLERALLLGGRWEAWGQALDQLRAAAGARGDRAAEAWVLHQQGSRLLCLEDHEGARQRLTRAVGIRESLGDQGGAAVTRHNLSLVGLAPSPAAPPAIPAFQPKRGLRHLLFWMTLPVLALLVISGLASRAFDADREPTEEPEVVEPAPVESSPPVILEEAAPAPEPDLTTEAPLTSEVPLTTEEPLVTDSEPPAEEPEIPEEPLTTEVTESELGWCCVDGEVSRLTEDACLESQGRFFQSRRRARFACRAESLPPSPEPPTATPGSPTGPGRGI